MLSPDNDGEGFSAVLMIAWSMVIASVLMLFIKAVATTTIGIFFAGDREIEEEKAEARSTLVNAFDLITEWGSAISDVVLQGFVYAGTIIFTFIFLILLAAILHLMYLYLPLTLGKMTVAWNGSIGFVWEAYVMALLRILQTVFEAVIGVYNVAIFFVLKMPLNILFHMVAGGYPDLVEMGQKLGTGGRALATSFTAYYTISGMECPAVEFAAINTTCFNPNLRQLDLQTPLQHVNDAMVHFVDFLPRRCSVLEQPAALLIYPLTDYELSKSIHHFVNAVLFTVFQAPILSVRRYQTLNRVSLALPDFSPAFDHLVFSIIHLGRVVDNWLDMTYYMLFTLSDPEKTFECDAKRGTWEFNATSPLGVFGKNHTVVTSLTPTMFAVTDGYHIEYHHHGRRSAIRTSVNAWPIPINVTYGVAAIAYARDMSRDDAPSGHTTALFGCSCAENFLEGIQLLCAVAPYENFDGIQRAGFVVNMTWEIANTPKRMSCRKTKVSVESLRYVSQRFTSPLEWQLAPGITPPITCMNRGQCTRIDAAVWVMPICPMSHDAKFSSVGGDSACMRALKDFSCFPFCLGVRRSFSGNEPIVIRSSSAWENNVLLTSRDCTIANLQTQTRPSESLTPSEVLDEDEAAPGTWLPGSRSPDIPRVKIKGDPSENPQCNVNDDAISSIPVLLEKRYNATSMFLQRHSYGADWAHADTGSRDFYRSDAVTDAMLIEHQPFVFAGDIALRTVTVCRDKLWDDDDIARTCNTVLDVMKITGNEFNEFQLQHIVPDGMAVSPRPTVARETERVLRPGMVTLPPVIVRSVYLHNPATATIGAVWYAVNPDYENLHCILQYCRELPNRVGCMQFNVLSNYDRLRVWKVVPYAGCEIGPEGAPICPPHAAQSVTFNDEFSMVVPTSSEFDVGEFCDESTIQNFYVEDMDAFDELNVIVTMRRGNRQGLYDELYGAEPSAETTAIAYTVHYFINVETMEIREGRPWNQPPVLLDGVGYLCSDMRVMPSLGSAVAEAYSSVILLLKMVSGVAWGSAALAEIYNDPATRCEKVALWHSAFEECGTKMFDLSDMFDAIARGNAYAWETLDLIARLLDLGVDGAGADAITTFLSGSRMYHENQVLLSKTAIVGNYEDLLNTGATRFVAGAKGAKLKTFRGVLFTMGSPAFMSGMSIGVAPLAYAEFTHKTLVRIVDRIIVLAKTTARQSGTTGSKASLLTLRYIAGNVSTILYESIRTDWGDIVINRSRRTCSGLSLMMGYTNAWARFLRHWCLAGVEMTDGMMQAFASLIVEVPFSICVCTRSIGHDFVLFMRDVCIPETADTLKPMAIAMLAFENDIEQHANFISRDTMQYMCAQSMEAFESRLHNAFAQWAEMHLRAGDATKELFDYVGVLAGRTSDNCVSLNTNPALSVIIPMPLDYFRVCGSTTVCKSFCKPYQDALDAELALRNGAITYPEITFATTVESPMFERDTLAAPDPYVRLLTLMEMGEAHMDCACASAESDCVGMVGVPYGGNGDPITSLIVRYYCIPIGLQERLYKVREWTIDDESSGYPISSFMDMDTNSRLLRVVFSVPYGSHILLFSQAYGYRTTDQEFLESFEQITATRSWPGLGTQLITSGPNLGDQCFEEISAAIAPTALETLGTIDEGYSVVIRRIKILDFWNVVSGDYDIDLVLHIDADVDYVDTGSVGGDAIRHVITTYIRVGWCEYFPSNFPGAKPNPPARQCMGTWFSYSRCLPVSNAFGQDLFGNWLLHGSFVYLPKHAGYVWVPQKRVAGSAKYDRMRFVNVSLDNGGSLSFDDEDQTYYLVNSRTSNKVLGGIPYAIANDNAIDPSSFTGHRYSLVGHWKNHGEDAMEQVPMWYTAASAIITRSWLFDIRYDARFQVLRGLPSRQYPIDVEVARYCNGHSCQGCATVRLRQICTNLQMCFTTRCIGTVVNHDSLFCNAGLLMDSYYSQSTSMYLAMWHAMSTIIVSALETQTDGIDPSNFRADWVSELVYTLMCESKDITAQLTSIIATIINKGQNVAAGEGSGGGTQTTGVAVAGLEETRVVNAEAHGQAPLAIAATHQFLFQMALLPLYVLVANYRWGVCLVNDVIGMASSDQVYVSLDSLSADAGATWGACSTQQTVESILQATPLEGSVGELTRIINDAFDGGETADDIAASAGVAYKGSFAGSIPSLWETDSVFEEVERGIDDDGQETRKLKKKKRRTFKPKGGSNPISLKSIRPVNYLIQMFDSIVAWMIGVITGMQDMRYNNDDPSCKVSDIAAQDAVQCACGDNPAWIVPDLRAEGVADGAFWCSGVLYVALDDGTFAHVYNPFSLQELGDQLQGMDNYLACISTSVSTECLWPEIAYFEQMTPKLNPMTVLARCRANYAQRQWDVGAFSLFSEDYVPPYDYGGYLFSTAREDALAWAESVGEELYECVTTTTDAADFPACLDIYLRLKTVQHTDGATSTGIREETYFAYREDQGNAKPSNPDACVLFTGPAANAETEATRTTFSACLEDTDVINVECSLPVLAWSGNLHGRVPIGTVHRDAIVDEEKRRRIADRMYATAEQEIADAFAAFDETSLQGIDSLFFSAEGDALHQMIDCMFLGPYSRIDYIISDADGTLNTLEWFRDNATGQTREFDLPCSGEKLRGDTKSSPFTCGSPARRSVIKYYVRDIVLEGNDASNITAELILARLAKIELNWRNTSNYGCNGTDGTISFRNCGDPLKGGVGWSPSVMDFGHVESQEIVERVTEKMGQYYRRAMTDTEPWTKYFTDGEYTEAWGDWRDTPEAEDFHLFRPFEPIVSFNRSEGFDSINGSSFLHSPWAVCAALLGQPMVSLPLIRYEEDGTGDEDAVPHWMPRFVREATMGEFDPTPRSNGKEESVFDWMTGLLRDAWERSPMYMHYVMRYVPSMSMVCEGAGGDFTEPDYKLQDHTHVRIPRDTIMYYTRPSDADASLQEIVATMEEAIELPLRGYTQATIGSLNTRCPCSTAFVWVTEQGVRESSCVFPVAVCETMLAREGVNATTSPILTACAENSGEFLRKDIPVILKDLRRQGQGLPCQDMYMSDQWGLFPFDNAARSSNDAWVLTPGTQFQDRAWQLDPTLLLAHRRSGITPANVEHVHSAVANNTQFGHHLRQGALCGTVGDERITQPVCRERGGALVPDADGDNLINDFIETLFPVAQLTVEPWGVSTCTRYLLEHVKHKFVKDVIGREDMQDLDTSLSRWQERCKIKAKQAGVCNALRIHDVVPEKAKWKPALPADCAFALDEQALDAAYPGRYYVTPACIMYVDGDLYNLHRCRTLNGDLPLGVAHLQARCRFTRIVESKDPISLIWEEEFPEDEENVTTVFPSRQSNPRGLVHFSGNGVLHWGTGHQFADGSMERLLVQDIAARETKVEKSRLKVDMHKMFVHALFGNILVPAAIRNDYPERIMRNIVFGNTDPEACHEGELLCKEAEFGDLIFDWWPEGWEAPIGYHPTGTCMQDEMGYRTFDSYMSVDREKMKTVYEHNALRHANMFTEWLGAGGLCRAHSVRMPLVETNTHRACTRRPSLIPNPSLYANRRLQRPAEFENQDAYSPEACAAHSSDVPWDTGNIDPTVRAWDTYTVGGVLDFLRSTYPGRLGRVVSNTKYPAQTVLDPDSENIDSLERLINDKHTVLPWVGTQAPLPDNDKPWEACVPPIGVVACVTTDASSCPASMQCVQAPAQNDGVGMCLGRHTLTGEPRRPCYRNDMCGESEFCMANGACGRVKMHLWNLHNKDVEFTRIQNETCGDETAPSHPNTQTFAKASPWETVPDLLRGHGLCAQRHQYSYRYALAHLAEAEEGVVDRVFVRPTNTNEAKVYRWPWVQQTPSGMPLTDDTALSEFSDDLDARFMHMHPHPCDKSYMHMKGTKVCSGINGDKDRRMPVYSLYQDQSVQGAFHTISNTNWLVQEARQDVLNTTTWMRTHMPGDDDRVVLSNEFAQDAYTQRGGFAFLGGDIRANETSYEGGTGNSRSRFLRCRNIVQCGLPPYTYNGVPIERGMFMDDGVWRLQKVEDVTQCGSLGFVMNAQECLFDIALFPLVRILASVSISPCKELMGAVDAGYIEVVQIHTSMPALGKCVGGVLCCTERSGFRDVWCKYAAISRNTLVDTSFMTEEAYVILVDKLNNIHSLGTLTQATIENRVSSLVAINVLECVEEIAAVNSVWQRTMYTFPENDNGVANANPVSGLYHALRYHLFEVPLLWYYKWMYRTIVWSPVRPDPFTNILQWAGVISLGEAWSRRASIEQGQIESCGSARGCICTSSATSAQITLKDKLLCLNAGMRDTLVDRNGDILLRARLRNEYMIKLRDAIKQDVKQFIREEFGLFSSGNGEDSDTVAGCFTQASWKVETCRENPECLRALFSAATGQDPMLLDPRIAGNKEFFVLDSFQRAIGGRDLHHVIDNLVDSMEFEDREFDPLLATVDANTQIGNFPFFRLLSTPRFNASFDDLVDDEGDLFAFDYSTMTDTERNESRCVVDEMMHPLESVFALGDEFSERPMVKLYADMARNLKVEFDVCPEQNVLFDTFPSFNGRADVKMSCSFRDAQAEQGMDYCDTMDHETACRKIDSFKDEHALSSNKDYFIDCSQRRDRNWDAMQRGMSCVQSPHFNHHCRNTGWTKAEHKWGGSNMAGTWPLMQDFYWEAHYDNDDDRPRPGGDVYQRLRGGSAFAIPWDMFNEVRGFDENDGQKAKTTCPVHLSYWDSGKFKGRNPGDTIPQAQPMNAICHNLESGCIYDHKDKFISPRVGSETSVCNLKFAEVPPGVAARFFTTHMPNNQWGLNSGLDDETRQKRQPVWAFCPNDGPSTDTMYDGKYDISKPNKADPRHYTGRDRLGLHDCTWQNPTLTDHGKCEDDHTCYVFSMDRTSEWDISHTDDFCQAAGGACSFSLTLANNAFCATANATGHVERACRNPEEHIFLVRGSASNGRGSGERSLWKCDDCIKYYPKHYTGRMQCGFQASGSAESYGIQDVVKAAKEYLSGKLSTQGGAWGMGYIQQLTSEYQSLFYGERRSDNLPYFVQNSNVAYLELQPLSFATSFEDWGGSNAECKATFSASNEDVDSELCAWGQTYDVTAFVESDNYYHHRLSALRCSVESPAWHEYGRCAESDEYPRKKLRRFARDVYHKDLGAWLPVLPARHGTVWDMDRSAAKHAFSLLFAEHVRRTEDVHARYVLGNGVCQLGIRENALCASVPIGRTERISLVNPWMGGDFNPWLYDEDSGGMGLDQCRRDSGDWEICCSCYPVSKCCMPSEDCPVGQPLQTSATTQRSAVNYFESQQHETQCKAHDAHVPPGQPLPTSDHTNICQRNAFRHHPEVCTHYQGLLGGSSGLSLGSIAELYHETETDANFETEPFLVADEIVLWRGAVASAAKTHTPRKSRFVSMPDNLIYPAHIVAAVHGQRQPLAMHAMQMEPNSGEMYDGIPIPVAQWVGRILHDFELDNATVSRLYPVLAQSLFGAANVDPEWHCPLRTATFWGRQTQGFNPLVPDPIRSDFMFSGNFYCKDGQEAENGGCIQGVHPFHETVEFTPVRDFFTTDGACFYDALHTDPSVWEAQQVDHSDTTSPCGLRGMLRRVLNAEWAMSNVQTPASHDCSTIMDWGGVPLNYRSGEPSPIQDNTMASNQSCPILARVPPFAFRVVSDAPFFVSTDRSTSDRGGDCHMGRATQINASTRAEMSQYELCVTVARTSTQASVRCTGGRVTDANTREMRSVQADRVFMLEREVRRDPNDIFNRVPHATPSTPRPLAKDCNVPDLPAQGPGEADLPYPETSEGTLHRATAEDMLANDIGRACTESDTCEIEGDAWQRNVFLHVLLDTPEALVTSTASIEHETTTMYQDIEELPDPIDDSSLWIKEWMLYNDGVTLGFADKETWRQDKFTSCQHNILEAVAADDTGTFVRPISICDITGPLQELCTKLQNIKQDIATANCIAQGDDCEILASYYTPAQWSPSNKAFARETVRDFYRFQAEDACHGESDRVQLAEEENQIVQVNCGATELESYKTGLQMARFAVRAIMAGFISVSAIMTNLAMLIFVAVPGTNLNVEDIVRDIVRHVGILFDLWKEGIMQMLDVAIYMLSRSPQGEVIAVIFGYVCKVATFVIEVILKAFLCNIIKFVVNDIIINIVDFIEDKLGDLSFGAITFPGWKEAKGAMQEFTAILPCTDVGEATGGIADGTIGCQFGDMDAGEQPPTHAFVATRCWANPTMGDLLGETNMLACSSSDTCIQGDIGGELGVCEQCPPVDVEEFSRFGCDMAVKKCRCSVPLQTRMQCVRNSDCRASVPCRLMTDPDSPSFGSVNCLDHCNSEPICLVDDAASNGQQPVGECTCMLTPPRLQTCDIGGGLVPLAVPAGVCMYARDRALADTIRIAGQNILLWASLAFTACPLLSRSGEHLTCQRVQANSGAVSLAIVGTHVIQTPDFLDGRRRILWEMPVRWLKRPWELLLPVVVEQSSASDWEGTGDCQALIAASRSGSGLTSVLDRERLKQCAKWRAVANTTILLYNLSHVPDTVLLTWTGLLETISKHAELVVTRPWASVLANPRAYAEACLYALTQLDGADTFVTTVRKTYYSARQWWTAMKLHWNRNPSRHPMQNMTRLPNHAPRAKQTLWWQGGEGLAGANLTNWTSMVAIPGLEQTAPWLVDWASETRSSGSHRRSLKQSGLWDDPARFEWDWSVDWTKLRSQWENEGTVCELFDITSESIQTMVDATNQYYNANHSWANRSNYSTSIYDTFMTTPKATATHKKATE